MATAILASPSEAWWKEASVYQISPSSFRDSNGDGVGDIAGVIEKLDYFNQLGVDIVWLCPIYKSPKIDMGYDVADYRDIDPQYGTLADVERLIDGLHQRGLKFLMDLVVNHTSDQARSAWEYDSASDEYYLHLFAKEQPDLNWEHPPVRAAVHDIIRFWLDKGVDGFRMDVINFISKSDGLPDAQISNPAAEYQHGAEHYACGPRLHEYLQDIGKILKEYDAFSVGEMPAVDDSIEVLKSVGGNRGELNMIFHFDIVGMDHGNEGKFSPRKWTMSDLKAIVNKWQTFMYTNNGWNALYLENHDQSRSISRWGSDKPEHRTLTAKMIATFLCFQSGTVFVYQGQELGMANMPETWDITEYRDLETLNYWDELKRTSSSDATVLQTARREINIKSRDHARTPVQWDSSQNAGFSTGQPWIRVNDDYTTCNAAAQVAVPGSVFEHWRSVLALRKELRDIFVYGDFELVDDNNDDVFAYSRSNGGRKAVVVCNFRETEVLWAVPASTNLRASKVLLSSYPNVDLAQEELVLRPFEAFVCL